MSQVPNTYRPVLVDAARDVAARYEKDIVIILSWDRAHDLVHTTTYGKRPEDKQAAAHLGPILSKAVGCDLARMTSFQDFRTLTQAEWASELETLHTKAFIADGIDFLRAGEGSSVTVCCDNPEGEGDNNCAIEVSDDWTTWKARRFYGRTLKLAIESAIAEKKLHAGGQ